MVLHQLAGFLSPYYSAALFTFRVLSLCLRKKKKQLQVLKKKPRSQHLELE
jgi:hypothetical protein